MGKIKKFGSQFCIVNTKNGVKGRCSTKRSKTLKMLRQAERAARRKRQRR